MMIVIVVVKMEGYGSPKKKKQKTKKRRNDMSNCVAPDNLTHQAIGSMHAVLPVSGHNRGKCTTPNRTDLLGTPRVVHPLHKQKQKKHSCSHVSANTGGTRAHAHFGAKIIRKVRRFAPYASCFPITCQRDQASRTCPENDSTCQNPK